MIKYTVTARTNNFAYGNNYALFIDAESEESAIEQCSEELVARGEKINNITARIATEEDERKNVCFQTKRGGI